MVLQVLLLMWLRTTINYMYKNGGTIEEAFTSLYNEGGIGRFYQGVGPALMQGPLSRFGDTAANEGVKALLESFHLSSFIVTLAASNTAALWRIVITPIDTFKTIMQVEGVKGISILMERIKINGVLTLYNGAFGTWAATFIGHYPWFAVLNALEPLWKKPKGKFAQLVRNACIGLCASLVSDVCSNSVRVIKTVKQTASVEIGYVDAFNQVIATDGVQGLFFRGLSVKLFSNAVSSILFTILWKYFMSIWEERKKKKDLEKEEVCKQA